MICRNCGMDNADNVQYCSNCGASTQQNPAPAYNAGQNNGGPTYVNVQVPSDTSNLVSIGAYVGMWFAMCVPILNIIMMIVWATSGNKSKKNFVLAYLILIAISVGITIIASVVIFLLTGVTMFAITSELETMIFSML
ncbi:MAG: zinc-ribbon domain-containing protein [Oscillospiraceae bacterium]|nr:zinc-ribbon domain-containing protein [Oscillospiraceae bacterium]